MPSFGFPRHRGLLKVVLLLNIKRGSSILGHGVRGAGGVRSLCGLQRRAPKQADPQLLAWAEFPSELFHTQREKNRGEI